MEKGPQTSAETSSQGLFGVGDIFRGSRCEVLMLAWHGMQQATFHSTLLSIPGNHTLERKSCLVLTIPWCPSWHMLMIRSCKLLGMTIWCPRDTTPSRWLSSWNTCAYFLRSGSALQALQLPTWMRGINLLSSWSLFVAS